MSEIKKVKLPNDSTIYDIDATTVNGHTIDKDVPSDAVFHYAVTPITVGSASKGADIPADDITNWSAGSATSASVSNGNLIITNGTAPSLSYTAKTIPNITTKKVQVVASVVTPDIYDYYGMIIHQAVSNPQSRIEYIGKNANYNAMTVNFTNGEVNYGGWATMPTLVDNKPAMIRTDGTFGYWLDEDDYSKKEDGVTASDVADMSYDGNAFAWFPAMWMKIIESGTDLEVRFAYSQLEPDYYEVCPSGSEGVWLPMFYGCPDGNGYMRSIANTNCLGGRTYINTTDAQETAIKKNGNDYYFLGGKLLDCITLLEMMWFKTTNSDDIGRGNQDGYNASAADGRYGTKSNPIVGGGQFYLTNDGKTANKILHCLPLATYDVWLRNPYFIVDNGTYKVSKDYSYDTSGATLTNTGLTIPSQGYIKELVYVNGYGLLPKTTGGSTTTYYCDHLWVNASIVSVPFSLGYCGNGRGDGVRAACCNGTAGGSYWFIGCALVLKQSR